MIKKVVAGLVFACLISFCSCISWSGVWSHVYVSHLDNVNEFNLFANGGWDGNWYVGYNTCWVTRLEVPDVYQLAGYDRAFIGAKLGRAKTKPVATRPPWEREPIPGQIYIAIASTPAWSSASQLQLVETKDMPVEGDVENALSNVGESRWFWVEVPLSYIGFGRPNYIALWSPSPEMVNVSSSPVLAAGWGTRQETHTWLNSSVKGVPPANPESALKTGVTYFEPAIAIKLVHSGQAGISVSLDSTKIVNSSAGADKLIVPVEVSGNGVERVWLESSGDGTTWERFSRYQWSPPYIFTVNASELKQGKTMLRAAAVDADENVGYSQPVTLDSLTYGEQKQH